MQLEPPKTHYNSWVCTTSLRRSTSGSSTLSGSTIVRDLCVDGRSSLASTGSPGATPVSTRDVKFPVAAAAGFCTASSPSVKEAAVPVNPSKVTTPCRAVPVGDADLASLCVEFSACYCNEFSGRTPLSKSKQLSCCAL